MVLEQELPMDATPVHANSSADEFRRGRLGMGWTQDALARTIGVSPDTIEAWENGQTPIPSKVLAWVRLYATAYREPSEMEMAA